MASLKLPKTGAMRSKMLKVKQAPSIKLSSLPSVTDVQRPMTRSVVGRPISRGEMI